MWWVFSLQRGAPVLFCKQRKGQYIVGEHQTWLWSGVIFIWTIVNSHQSFHFSEQVKSVCLTMADMKRFKLISEVWWIVCRVIKVLKGGTCRLFSELYLSIHMCALVDKCKRRRGTERIPRLHSSLSYPAVVQSGDLVEPSISVHLSLQAVKVLYRPGYMPALT